MKYLPILLILISGCSRFISPSSYERGMELTIVPHKSQVKITSNGLLELNVSDVKDDIMVVISEKEQKVWVNLFYNTMPSIRGAHFDLVPIESSNKNYFASLHRGGKRIGYIDIENKKDLTLIISISGRASSIIILAKCKEDDEIREPTEADLIFFKF